MGNPVSDTPSPRGGLLRNGNFVLLWCAYGISAMGDHLSEMAILKTQDAVNPAVDVTPLTARMSFMFFLPFFFLAPVAGLIADRLPRRVVMIAADVARGLIMLGFAGLIAWTEHWGAWGPFMPLLLVGAFAGLFAPARSALLPTVVRADQLVRANAMIAGLGIIATMIAVTISGYLAEHYHPQVAFRLDAVTFALSALFLAFLRPPVVRSDDAGGRAHAPLRELADGFRYALCHRRVLELLAVGALVWFCGPLVNSVIPAVVRDVYGGTYLQMSAYRAYLGLGFILGAITIATLGNALRSEIAITWGLFGISGGIAVFAASVYLPMAPETLSRIGAVGVVMAGLFAVAVMASFNALLQRTVADRFRGRIFGVKELCCTGALLVATGALGVPRWTNVDRWVGKILIAVAVITLVAGAVTLFVRLGRGLHGRQLTFAQNLNEFLAKFWWRFRRIGAPTVPREGAVIITANHTCSADPLFLSAGVMYRAISFMVAAEYTTWPIVRYVLSLVECIPVKRDGRDTAATKSAMRHLRAGKALGIFIEGRIVAPTEVVRPKDGVAMLALKTGATGDSGPHQRREA